MTDTPPSPTGLAAPGARAVLIGTGDHVPESLLPALPSVGTTLDDLERVLHDVCGMSHVHRVPAGAAQAEVVAAVEDAVAEATGPVLFAYVGHGILGPGDELYLATHASLADDRVSGAVPYRTVKDLLGDALGGSVVVLDCCFSGRATAPDGSERAPYASARPDGSFLLTSASQFALSFAPEGARHTLFSGRLLRLLEDGDPGGPPWLTVDYLHGALDRAFRDGPVRPHGQSEGRLGGLVVARNAAYRTDAVPTGEPPADVPCPYPGMRSFGAADQEWFFGREELTEQLVATVCDPAPGHPVVLVGASGSGKSSLLGAGLLASLEARHGAGHATVPWPALLLPAPGSDPVQSLAERWARTTGRRPEEIREAFEAGRFPGPAPGHRACRLLVVDHFEEVFTRCEDAGLRSRFIRLLCGRPSDPGDRPTVVLALRADHYGDCLAHPELVDALDHGQFTVAPMDLDTLRAAIERPAARAGLALEDGLVDRLLSDLRRGGGAGTARDAAAPFLAHVLVETWRERSGTALTLAGYQRTGGIWQSVTTSTDTLYQALREPQRHILRRLLLSMVHLTPAGEVVRREVAPSDLLKEGSAEGVRTVWDHLVRTRLVTVDHDGARFSHDALLHAWPKLRSWIRDAHADLLEHQRLAESAAVWEEHDRDPHYLYTGSQLAQARARLDPALATNTPGIALTGVEREFLATGAQAARRGRRLRMLWRGVAACVALLLVAIGTVAYVERSESRKRADELASKRVAAQADALRDEDPATALDLSLAAYRRSPTVEARSALLRSALSPTPPVPLRGHSREVINLAYRAGGKILASSSTDGTVRLWRTANPYRPSPGSVLRVGRPAALAWHPDGRYLTASTRDALYVWNVRDAGHPRRVARVPVRDGRVFAAAFSPDGRTLAVGAEHGRVWLWDLRDPRRPVRTVVTGSRRGKPVEAVAFAPGGKVMATAVGDGTVQMWNTADVQHPKPGKVLRDALVLSLAFSPDGRLLAGGGASGEVAVWKVTDPARPHRSLGTGPITSKVLTSIAFSPDGQYAAASSWDGTPHLFNVRDETYSDPLLESTALPRTGKAAKKDLSLAYRPDGRGIAVGGSDGLIHLWNPPPDSVPGTTDAAGSVSGSASGPQGRFIATTTRDRAHIWRLGEPGTPPVEAAVFPRPWNKARFLPGGRTLIAQSADWKRLRLWSFRDGRLRPGYEFRPAAQSEHSLSFAVASRGGLLAVADPSVRAATIWDIHRPARPKRLGRVPVPEDGYDLAFSGGGRVFAVLSYTAQFWDLTDPRHPRRTSRVGTKSKEVPMGISASDGQRVLVTDAERGGAKRSGVWSVSARATARKLGTVDADALRLRLVSGRLLAGISSSGRPALWSVDRLRTTVPLPGPIDAMKEMASDGNLLVAWAEDGGLGLWRLAPEGSPPGDAELLALSPGFGNASVKDFTEQGDAMVVSPSAGFSPMPALGAGTVLVSVDFPRLSDRLCSVRRTATSGDRWHRLFSDLRYRDPCP
ncbi:WD40 repeat domain-containing protein [Streptomyces sp. 4503]|uniref:WD40 repeat domain-containing protein n=1 Tax=Streptomyces niphimycinicus TaxID=2842201 RepID=A0ABS6CDU9_9ACTN|nr:caspase family protein [Streptomyces niphimycinicus]MBU3865102.1 WD40 repeat domain-containing protein [Streptomyces niphimycinicus]